MTDFLTIATDLIEKGFRVIPLKPAGKDPMPEWGVSRKTGEIEKMYRLPKDCNVGICTDENFVILETDDEMRLRELVRNSTGHELPITLMAGARHNRPHFFFKATDEALAASNFQVPGLFEARFVNAYVVGAGSTHPTGAVYRWLNDYQPVPLPGWLLTALRLIHGDERQRNPVSVDLDAETMIGAGEGRHYLLTTAAGKWWDGEISEEELFEKLWALNLKRNNPPYDLPHVLAIARHYVNKAEPNDPGPRVVLGGRVLEPFKFGPRGSLSQDKPDHIIPSKGQGFGEWFPRGEVSLICAPSGMGKTKLMLGTLEGLRKGEPLFGHPATKADYRILTADRSLQALRRSVINCGLDAAAVMHRAHKIDILDPAPRHEVLDRLLKTLEEDDQLPDLVFVDGMDIWVPKAAVSDLDVVVRFLQGLIDVARQWNIAIIGSVGSPKQKMKDRYVLTRDQVLGSIGWGRTVETIGFMSLVDTENADSIRKVIWLPREGKSEAYHFTFDEKGHFVETHIDSVSEPEGVEETRKAQIDYEDYMIRILTAMEPGTRVGANDFPAMSKSSVNRHLQSLALTGWTAKNAKGQWIAAKPKGA